MNKKFLIAFGIAGFLVLSSVGYFTLANTITKSSKANISTDNAPSGKQTPEINFDFGDAPDGKDGQFPSLLASNGSRTKKTDEVWLGQEATMEKNSKQVNKDEADDGVKLNTNPCRQSTAYFFVRIKNPGKMKDAAYLNLYADWNNDKKWSGNDGCAKEWAVQNFPIDLSKQTDEIAVYKVQFTGGKNTEKIWYRGGVTLNEQMNETATGEFASGEVEDYGPKSGDKRYYNFYCMPDPLVISHGSKGNVKILPDFFSEPIFDIQFGKNFKPKNFKRQATIQDKTFTFESSNLDVDGPKRSVPHFVDVRVRFGKDGKEAVLEKSCTVIVEHDELTIKTPSRKSSPIPSEIPQIKTESGGATKTESQEETPQTQTESHPIQEGIPALQ